ncbi:hypothetical protein AB0910_08835 [Streptomyces sp. NPDC047002]|uniref:hypothetical protein n=1 Tax=Streptomyces sp. NPDC047002 TaxID=3155475 RepID=UPI0034573195
MGKASKKKQERRAQGTSKAKPMDSAHEDDPQALGNAALQRLLRTNEPRRLSLAGAYSFGYLALAEAQVEENEPHWYQEIDPLDALFLGTAWPERFSDEHEFANSRDAWLRLLRDTTHGKDIERFVRESVSASEDLGLPVDDGKFLLALAGRLEAAGLDRRRLPRRLLPDTALQGCRAVFGPSPGMNLPEQPKNAAKKVKRFWAQGQQQIPETAEAVLREGLRRFWNDDLPVEQESALLLPALYGPLMTKPGELLENMGDHAWAWALSLDETSSLLPVLDILITAPGLGLSVTDTLKHLFAVPAFTQPIPSDALLWTSSPGLALPRLAFELGFSKVRTRDSVIRSNMLDYAGMQMRMHLSTANYDAETSDSDNITEAEYAEGTPGRGWEERSQAVHEAVVERLRKKTGGRSLPHRSSGNPVERIWNADGSSVVRILTETPEGQLVRDAHQAQLRAFKDKFGREPVPGDPLFFDPDVDEPTRLSEEYFDDMMLEMAENAAEIGIDPAFLHASREVGYMVTEMNRNMFTVAEVLAFTRAVERHRIAQ